MDFVTASKMLFICELLSRTEDRILATSLGCSFFNLSGHAWEMGLTTLGLCFGQHHLATQ